jgi:outer membrane protein OmpA-like peptidoglycan-associated protein
MADGINDLPQVTDSQLAASVSDIELNVSDIEITRSIRDVEQVKRQGNETVVALRSDILFAFGKAQLPESATARITALVSKVARGGALSIGGHTDNVGADAANVALSRARATTVATVVAKARPDIKLTVQGFGESRPVAANETGGKDNPEGRAQNRRVELRYQG